MIVSQDAQNLSAILMSKIITKEISPVDAIKAVAIVYASMTARTKKEAIEMLELFWEIAEDNK